MKELTEQSKLEFGTYKGKHLINVPVGYLEWFYRTARPLIAYIEKYKIALMKEDSDVIWED